MRFETFINKGKNGLSTKSQDIIEKLHHAVNSRYLMFKPIHDEMERGLRYAESCLHGLQEMMIEEEKLDDYPEFHNIVSLVTETLQHLRLNTANKIEGEMVELPSLFNHCISVLYPHYLIRNTVIDADIASDLPDIWIDKLAFTKIIIGLLLRSINFMSVNHEVQIYAQKIHTKGESYLSISIADSGYGTEEWRSKHIGDQDTSFVYISDIEINCNMPSIEYLVDMLNGQLDVEDNKGHGVTYYLLFPYQTEAPQSVDDIIRGHNIVLFPTFEK